MITPSVSWFVKDQKDADTVREFAELGLNIQLAFYERKDAETWMLNLHDVAPYVTSLHLPKGLMASDYSPGGIVDELCGIYGVTLMVVHPWANDLRIIVDVVKNTKRTLCLETFGRKGGGNPFLLLAQYGEELMEEHVGLCVDFSHLESDMVVPGFIKGLMPYTKMWHVSNKLQKQQHLPIFMQNTDTNAQRILAKCLEVKDFPIQEIVLEYMPDYKDKLVKQYLWLNSYIQQKRRKVDGTV